MLGISRSNVSMGIKELESWRLVRKRHLASDRRDYSRPPTTSGKSFARLPRNSRKREVDPTLSLLRDILMDMPGSVEEQHAQAKMRQTA